MRETTGTAPNRISLADLILKVSTNVDLDMEDLKSSKRNRKISYARAVISHYTQFGNGFKGK